jgi:hypothetical protein
MWTVNGKLSAEGRAGVDASGWVWELSRGDETRRVLVEITGTALASNASFLPADTRAAITSEGRSALDSVLASDEPARVITCGTDGCRPGLLSQ